MRYWLLAAVSALSAFTLFLLAGAVLAAAARRVLTPLVDRASAAGRAQLLFAIRVLPMAAATIAAFAVALPIFLWFEDPGTAEAVGVTLAAAACAGTLLLLRGLWRAVVAWRATTLLVAAWQRRARRVDSLPLRFPAYAIEEAFPTVAVAGVFRPRLFIAERVLREFPAGEIDAMVAHECAHVSSFDNIKRLLMRACPDLPGTAAVERDWAAAAEQAADARAATRDPAARLDLAAALIHVARLAAPSAPQLASAFYLGGGIDARVRRLVESPPAAAPSRWPPLALPAACAVIAIVIVLVAPSLHAVMEQAVRLLP